MIIERKKPMIFCHGRALTSLLLVLLAPVFALAVDVMFLVTSDSHYDALENEDRNKRNRATIEEMNRIAEIRWPDPLGGDLMDRPRGVAVLGDVIDDGDRMKNEKNQSELQFRYFLADFGLDGTDGRLRYPVFEGWGNHDGPPVGRERFGFSFQSNLKSRNALRLQKGLVDHVSANGLHYSWNWDGVHFVQVNLYPGNTPHPETRYSAAYHDPQASLDFLKADLAANVGRSGQPVVIMHHYDLQGTDWWHEEERKAYYDVIKPYNVTAVFHGHTGTGVYRWKPDGEEQAIEVVNTGQTENGFFVVQVTEDRFRLAYRVKEGVKTVKASDGRAQRLWDGTWGWRHWSVRKMMASEK
jgi:cytolysin (calcineurin-like family phosphatase)